MLNLHIKETFTTELPADNITDNNRRQVENACFSYVKPTPIQKTQLVHVSDDMTTEIGLSQADTTTQLFTDFVTGNYIFPDTKPFAMCYGGHQFGHWAGQLGDGRAINLTEIEHNNNHWAIQLKGAGETPYSRNADGLAVLRSSVREYLCSEAMFHLGVPTTRALSLALSGDEVLRDVLYNGNAAYEKGAIVCRVAPSFSRFGNYEIFASRGDTETLKTLVDYTLKHFYPHLGNPCKEAYLAFFKEVATKTLDMIIHWQRVRFVHGVMNPDNMSILGLTIDYGPYGWLEEYAPNWTPNTTDAQHKRYRFGNQSNIGLWNLLQLANALYPLIEEASGLEAVLNQYKIDFEQKELAMKRAKLGLSIPHENDTQLITELEQLLEVSVCDYTLFYRQLPDFNSETNTLDWIIQTSYNQDLFTEKNTKNWLHWFTKYNQRLSFEKDIITERKIKMNLVNPKYVFRNYMAQVAIDAADNGDYSIIEELFQLLKKPYDEQPENQKWFAKRPNWADDKIGCSMLSCSS